jgi:iron-sulfur cluster repair protein YtfE (RIC family)
MRHPSLILLSHDHHHGLALALRCRKQALGQLKPMGAAGLRERAQEVLDFYASNLVAHFRAEEEVLFPLIHDAIPGNATMIDELIKDHDWIRHAVPKLRALTGLAKLIFDFGDLLERHIRKEERELFPLFEKELNADKAAAIGVEIKTILETKQEDGKL